MHLLRPTTTMQIERVSYVSRTGREGLNFRMVTALAKKPFAGDKILILRAGTVATLRKVVLVQFTGILAEHLRALMVVDVLLLLQFRVIMGITHRPLPDERCISQIYLINN